MVHAALLLLMLEAVTRTSFHHQPEAQHPKIFSYPQAGPADYTIFRALNGLNSDIAPFPKNARSVSARCPAQGLAASSDIRAISLEAPIT
jgi:hypothetical protein